MMLEIEIINTLRKIGYKIIADYNSGQILVHKNGREEMLSHDQARKIVKEQSK